MPYEENGVIHPDKGTQTPNQLAREMDKIAAESRAEYLMNALVGRTAVARGFRLFFIAAFYLSHSLRD